MRLQGYDDWLYGYFTNDAEAATSSTVAQVILSARRGVRYALFVLAREVTEAVAPAIAGYVVQVHGVWSIFPLAIGSSIAGLLLFQRVLSNRFS